jgi:hypothetical protein
MNCPKCGFGQEEGPECLRCGLIYARYHEAASLRRKTEPSHSSVEPIIGLFRRFYRIFRWASLAGLIAVIILILHASPPPQIVVTPDAAHRAEAKIQEFKSSANQGTEQTLEMDTPELNGWLGKNLALKRPQNSTAHPSLRSRESMISLAKKATGDQAPEDTSMERAQSSVRDVKIELQEDSLRLYATMDLHGVDLSLQLEGQLLVRDGYMRLEPTSGKLGSFPLMSGTLRSVADRLFDSPENKEKFRLPPYIRDIRIEHGQLMVISR